MDTTQLQQEFATWENAFGYSPSSFLGYLPDPDPVLRKLGNEAELLNDLMADDQVTMAVASRKSRVLNNQRYEIRPSPKCEEGTLELSEITTKRLIEDLENCVMYDCISTILNAPFYGYSVLEIMWEPRDGWWHIAGLVDKPWHWFNFNDKGQLTFRNIQKRAQILPEGKCVVTRHFPTYENPYGLRLLSRCYWPVAFKRGGIQFYVKFVEKYGIPWPIGTAAPGATEIQKRTMAHDLQRMVGDAAAVIPHGSTVDIVTPGTETTIHEKFLCRWDAAISKVLMGQTLTAEVGDTGSYAAAKTHLDVAGDTAAGDRHLVTSAFNELCWIYNKINTPSLIAPVFSYIEDRDLEQRVKLDKELYAMGVRFNKAYYQSTYQLEAEHFEVVDETAAPKQPAFASVSDSKGDIYQAMKDGLKARKDNPETDVDAEVARLLKMQDELDLAITKLAADVIDPNEKLNMAIENAVKSAKTYDEAQANLDKLIGDTSYSRDLAQILHIAMFHAYCFGLAGGELPDGCEHLDLTIGLDPKYLRKNRHG